MRALLELLAPSVCPACDCARREGEPLLCAECARELGCAGTAVPGVPGARSLWRYEGSARRLIQRFKFEARSDALAVLVPALAEELRAWAFDGIVPIPRHPRRVRQQQGDPVWELARALARHTATPLEAAVLRRVRSGPAQVELPRAQRLRAPRGAFRARPDALRGRRVLLLDDVATTGATLREARRALAAARPRYVLCAAVASTPRDPANAL